MQRSFFGKLRRSRSVSPALATIDAVGLFVLLNRKHAGNKSTAGLFVLRNRKHAGNSCTAGLFILLNRKHAGNELTAERTENNENLRSSN